MLFFKGKTLGTVQPIDERHPTGHSPRQDKTGHNRRPALPGLNPTVDLKDTTMTNYRTLTAVAALALSAFAAHAQSNNGDASIYPSLQSAPSTLTREAVIAELVSARESGTLPRGGDWYDVPAPLALSGQSGSTVTRAEVRAQAVAAARAGETANGNQ